jgi:hypothetical protein
MLSPFGRVRSFAGHARTLRDPKRRSWLRLRPSPEPLETRALLTTFTTYPIPATDAAPLNITSGPDGNLWYTAPGFVGKMTTSGNLTIYRVPAASSRRLTWAVAPGTRTGEME